MPYLSNYILRFICKKNISLIESLYIDCLSTFIDIWFDQNKVIHLVVELDQIKYVNCGTKIYSELNNTELREIKRELTNYLASLE